MCTAAPQNDAGGDPLKCESGSVERKPIHLRGAWHLHELADAAASEKRDSDAEKNYNESEVPIHDGK